MTKIFLLSLALLLSACANTQYAGVNYAHVTTPDGESWTIASGKDQTNTHFEVKRGDTTVTYSSEREDATAALTAALKAQTNLIKNLLSRIPPIVP